MTEHILRATAALNACRQVRPWLAEAPAVEAQPGLRRASAPRDMTTRRAARTDRLLRLERAERSVSDIPSTPQPAPVRAELLDAPRDLDQAVVDAAWIVASGLRRRDLLVIHHQARLLWRDPWAAAILQLTVGLPWLTCTCPMPAWWIGKARQDPHRGGCGDRVAVQVAELLELADERARTLLGMGTSWTPMPGRVCQTCHRRTIQAEVTSADERDWIAKCANGCWIRRVQDAHGARDMAVFKSIHRHQRKLTRRTA